MPHPLVTQLRFTRSEFRRGLARVTAEEAARRFGPINPIAWMIGHLAWQEQLFWLERAQGKTVVPEVKQFGFGKPLTVPPLDEAWAWWRKVTAAADPYLDTLGRAALTGKWPRARSETRGTKLHRTTYHYWFHLGESQATAGVGAGRGSWGDAAAAPSHGAVATRGPPTVAGQRPA